MSTFDRVIVPISILIYVAWVYLLTRSSDDQGSSEEDRRE